MKNSTKILLVTCCLSSLLVACGGGGSGDNVNSSGASNSGSTNTGGNNSGSTNTGGNNSGSSNNAVITASCSSNDEGKSYIVTTSGCLIKTSSNTQTSVCTSSNTMKMLTGSGFTKDQVIAGGSSFTAGNNLSINGVIYKCG